MILRGRICIPTFDNPAAIAAVVRDCLEKTTLPILVVDDGSTQAVSDLLGPLPDRVRVLRLPRNLGKGAAIQAAIRDSVAVGYTHLVTIDGDGQHLACEIPKVLELARENPWDLIIGSRKLVGEDIPGATRFGRRFSNFWVSYQTAKPVTDSQSGFRLYPLFRVQNLRFFTRRYDFEIEVLIRLLWQGVGVREVEIDCYYPPRETRVSHFDKFWDNLRISALNTALVVISLFRGKGSPARISTALGVGVCVGCTPFFGFHSVIVAALAVAFRLNFLLLWVGTQISIPPLAPFLALASLWVGSAVTGRGPDLARLHEVLAHPSLRSLQTWLLGSLVLGAALGLVVGLLSYLVIRQTRARPRRAKANWTGRMRGGKIGNGILKWILRHVGLRAAYFCLTFIAPYFYLFAPKARRAAQEYWQVARPDAGAWRRQGLVLRQFAQFGRLLLDRVYQAQSGRACFESRPHGREHIRSALASGRGTLILTAHVGGWDTASAFLREEPVVDEFHRVEYEANGPTLSQVAGDHGNGRPGMRGGPRPLVLQEEAHEETQPIFALRQLLEQGKAVGLMGDRPLGSSFELVPFLGKLAPFDTTPFRLAAACRCPVQFAFGFKAPGLAYDMFATPPKTYSFFPGEDKGEQCARWAREFADALGELLRRYPEQWSNFFPFWSALPSLPPGISSGPPRSYWSAERRTPEPREADSELVPTPSAEPALLL